MLHPDDITIGVEAVNDLVHKRIKGELEDGARLN